MDTELAVFQDRAEAGRVLADRLTKYTGSPDVVVLALPRGGVPVGFRVARSLGAPLDVLSVRKLVSQAVRSWPWAPSPATAPGL
jgi:putative phosphoribosyl transferase